MVGALRLVLPVLAIIEGDFSVVIQVHEVILENLGDINGVEDVRLGEIDAHAINLGPVDHRDVVGLVRQIFEGGVEQAVVGIEVHVAHVGRQVLDRADEFATEVVFREQRGERVVDVAAIDIHGDALHVAGRPFTAVLREWQDG